MQSPIQVTEIERAQGPRGAGLSGYHLDGRIETLKVRRAALPGWAWDVLAAEERRYGLSEIRIQWRVWRKQRHPQSSGTAFPLKNRIVVTAGTDERDQLLMLLHELGHIVAGPNHGHDARWQTIFEDLCAGHGLTDYATQRDEVMRLLASPEVRNLLFGYAAKSATALR